MLADIVFDRGTMILGFRDRTGDQTGCGAGGTNPADLNSYAGFPTGDILRACPVGGGWVVENNATCGGVTGGGQNNQQGPGTPPAAGEFYSGDTVAVHDDNSWGGLVQVPGYPDVVQTAQDVFGSANPPQNVFSGSVQWLMNSNGANTKGYLVYNNPPANASMGKANGLGDLEALAQPAPIEIGNRVWNDSNGNGIQDPDEPGLAGVTVRLYNAAGQLIATAVTDSNGEYYFSSGAGVDSSSRKYGLGGFGPDGVANTADDTTGLKPSSRGVANNYQIRLDLPADFQSGGPLFGFALSPANADPSPGGDARDSDAIDVVNPPGSPAGAWPVVTFTAGSFGANNHTYDFGLNTPPLIVTLADFTATPSADHVLLAWSTVSEIDNLGFNLWRGASPDDPSERLNDTLIPSQAPGNTQGFDYTWTDTTVAAGATATTGSRPSISRGRPNVSAR